MARRRKQKTVEDLQKNWSIHDIIGGVRPLSEAQRQLLEAYYQGYQICAYGSAGTGKTFLAAYLAICDVLQKKHDRIILVRSAVQSREIGHLPGTLEEKISLYEMPYRAIFGEIFKKPTSYDHLKEVGLIEFNITSFVRGNTWDDAIVIVDEVQNMAWHEINTVMTRLGKNTRVIICGDLAQNDLVKHKYDASGMDKLLDVVDHMEEFDLIRFTKDDIIRSELVKSWIIACEEVL